MIVLVTYDLKSPSSQYTPLYEYLKGHKGWMHYLTSTRLIDTDKTPDEITDDIGKYLQKGDLVLVIQFDNPYQGLLPAKAWDWVKRHKEQPKIQTETKVVSREQ